MTDAEPVVLNELELDALTELVNLGVSNAAVSLREMVREEVVLAVPRVVVITREEAIANIGEQESKRLVAVHQDFEGEIRGRAMLIFPEAKSLEPSMAGSARCQSAPARARWIGSGRHAGMHGLTEETAWSRCWHCLLPLRPDDPAAAR